MGSAYRWPVASAAKRRRCIAYSGYRAGEWEGISGEGKEGRIKGGARKDCLDKGRMVEFVDKQVEELKKLWSNKRQLAFQALNLAMIVLSALMIWKSLMVLTKSESPVVVVLSGSMEPAFQRGDILFLNNGDDPLRAGEVVVFKIKDREIPIVHRVMNVHEKPDGTISILTKGDSNKVNDRGLYVPGQMWLGRDAILGRARGTLRYVGMVTIILNDYPPLKYVLVGLMGLFVLTNREA